MKIIAIIPAHMASVRFPGKILFPFYGLPMIEHVRRRALLSNSIAEVIVATCDQDIAKTIRSFGGKVLMTANTHKNGTTRVAEAIKDLDCTHVLLLQGDEPLLLPRHIDEIVQAIKDNPKLDAWNATGPIESADELDRNSFVKCSVGVKQNILYCFRRTPGYSNFEVQQKFVRKILGVIAYRKDALLEITNLDPSAIEQAEFIEQMRIIENGFGIHSVAVEPSLPSVNEPNEADIVLEYIQSNREQQEILKQYI